MLSTVLTYLSTEKPKFKAYVATYSMSYVDLPFPGYNMSYAPYYYDANVKSFQDRLYNIDDVRYPCGISDGYFGSKTVQAVKNWQMDHGLVVDGVVGKNTWDSIFTVNR
jgi:peptidoglycan hydrolase-like protein with peptidoglycan-binding domain